MMKIKQHIPNFCSDLEPQEVEFNSLTELIAIPWVKQWMDGENFFRLSISNEHHLMAEVDAGKKWWVIGYLSDYQLDLPKWTTKNEDEMEKSAEDAWQKLDSINRMGG